MRAVIYARRSQEHQEESVDRQVKLAKEYIARKGWTLVGTYPDDQKNTGRREFVKRTQFLKLLADAEDRTFDVVVCRDHTRLGGDTSRTMRAVEDLRDCEVAVWYYLHDREVKLNNWTDKILLAVESGAAEGERDAIASRVHESLSERAKSALCAGGAVYGYTLVPIMEGSVRKRTEYRVNEVEAAVLREMFARYADGTGLKSLTADFNLRGLASPKAGTRGVGRWSPSAIRPMLMRERYVGRLVWGKKAKTYRKGTKVRVLRDESAWTVVEAPELRIIDDATWAKVQGRFTRQRSMTGRTGGKAGQRPTFLLSGLGKCSVCGGSISAEAAKWGPGSVPVYLCKRRRSQGGAVCTNTVRRPVHEVDASIIEWLRSTILTEAVVTETMKEIRKRLVDRSKVATRDVGDLGKQAAKLRGEIDKLATALLATDAKPTTIVRMMAEREAQLREVDGRLAASHAAPSAIALETRRIEREAGIRLKDLRALLVASPKEMRRAVEALLDGPITFSPVQDLDGGRKVGRYQLTGRVAVGDLYLGERPQRDSHDGASVVTLEMRGFSLPFSRVA